MTALTIYTQATSRPTRARGALQKDPEKPVPINQVIGTRALQGLPESHKEGHRTRARLCYSYRKLKGPMLENIFGYAVAAPTDKRGFVMSGFVRHGVSHVGMVTGRMGHTARLAARRIPCFQHPAHPRSLKTARVASESRYGAETMTQAIATLARTTAPTQSQADTSNPEVIRLHIQAENALASALHLLRSIDCDPAKLQAATGRAIRAATMLKRLSAAQAEGGAA